jgi:hypothetical protein
LAQLQHVDHCIVLQFALHHSPLGRAGSLRATHYLSGLSAGTRRSGGPMPGDSQQRFGEGTRRDESERDNDRLG